MGHTTTIVAVCLLAAVAEGYLGGFNNYGFRGFPQMQFPRLPQPPRLPGFGQFPFFGNNGFLNFPTFDVANAKPPPGGVFHGIAVSSTSNDKGGSTVVTSNHNGITETFVTDPQRGFVVAQSPGIDRLLMQSFQFPEIKVPKFQVPEIKVPKYEVPEIKVPKFNFPETKRPKVYVPDFEIPEFPKMKPIYAKPGSKIYSDFQGYGVSSSSHMSSVNGEPPKIVAQISSIRNDNGKVNAENYKFSNVDD